MTTIAYKGGIVAYDSRVTAGSQICSDSFDKRVAVGAVQFFMVGTTSDFTALIEAYMTNAKDCDYNEANALVVDGYNIYVIGVEDDLFYKCPVTYPTALGSGTSHALTAMDMGADAVTAVKMAIKRDSNSGGKVRRYVINKSKG